MARLPNLDVTAMPNAACRRGRSRAGAPDRHGGAGSSQQRGHLAQSVDTHRPDAASRKRLALHGCRGVVTALLMMVAFAVPAWAQPVANPASPGPAGGATAAWRVVILNGADPTLPAFVAIDTALRAGLAAPGRHPVEVFAESLDMMRFPSNELEPEMLALLRKKYASRHV
ncbi:MAG TPA: hypothetical protein VGI14_05275, partial [Casimicrobiaceae bacterium]